MIKSIHEKKDKVNLEALCLNVMIERFGPTVSLPELTHYRLPSKTNSRVPDRSNVSG